MLALFIPVNLETLVGPEGVLSSKLKVQLPAVAHLKPEALVKFVPGSLSL